MSRAMMWPSNWDCRLKSTESKLWESALPVYNNSWAGVCTSYGETDGSQRSPCWSRFGREAVHGKSCCSCKRSRGGARGDSPLLGFGKSSWTSGELVGSGVVRQVSCPINRSPDWLVIRGARFPALWIMPAMSSGVQEGSSFPVVWESGLHCMSIHWPSLGRHGIGPSSLGRYVWDGNHGNTGLHWVPEVPSSEAIHSNNPLWRTCHSCHYPCLGCSSGGLGRRPWSCLLSSPSPCPCLCLWISRRLQLLEEHTFIRPPWSRKAGLPWWSSLPSSKWIHLPWAGKFASRHFSQTTGVWTPKVVVSALLWRAHRTNHTIHPRLTWWYRTVEIEEKPVCTSGGCSERPYACAPIGAWFEDWLFPLPPPLFQSHPLWTYGDSWLAAPPPPGGLRWYA